MIEPTMINIKDDLGINCDIVHSRHEENLKQVDNPMPGIFYNSTVLTNVKEESLRKIYLLKENQINEIPYRRPYRFNSESFLFSNLDDFWNKFQIISNNPYQMLIRGVADSPTKTSILRRKNIFREPAPGANWFQLDVDGYIDVPKGILPYSPDAIEYFLINNLPPEFQNISYVYQFSNGAGILNPDGSLFKPGLRVHLYFFTDRNLFNRELKSWIPKLEKEGKGIIDHSLFNEVQPHYTAAEPIIDESIVCTITKRQDIVYKAEDVIHVPPIPHITSLKKSGHHYPYTRSTTHSLNHDQQINDLLDKLSSIGCLYAVHDKTINIWHPGEKTPGGWFIYSDNPYMVYHPNQDNNHKPMSLDEWLEKYWHYLGEATDEEPLYKSEVMNPNDAQEMLRKAIIQFREDMISIIIKATAGLGKTEEAIKILLGVGKIVHILVPNHKLAKELKRKILKEYPYLNGVVIKGRNQKDMCRYSSIPGVKKIPILDELSAQSLSIYSHLCHRENDNGEGTKDCPEFKTCQYLRQFENAERYDFVILTHNALINPQMDNLLLPSPDYVVIDESFWKNFVGNKTVKDEEINSYIRKRGIESENKILRELLVAKNNNVPLLKHMREQNISRDDLRDAVESSKLNIRHECYIVPGIKQDELNKALKNIKSFAGINILFKCLYDEYGMERGSPHSITIKNNIISNTLVSNSFVLHYRKDLQRYESTPMLILDADADQQIIEKVMNRKFNYVDIPAKRSSKIIQMYSSTLSLYHLLQPENEYKIDDINKLIRRESEGGKKVLVVCPKKIKEIFIIPAHCAIEHFGNIRGLDIYKDYDVCIIVGRNQPSVEQMENYARSLFYDDEEQLLFLNDGQLHERRLRYHCKSMSKTRNVSYHPDNRVNLILNQIRECETVQAASRIRDIWNAGKKIILLSNVVVDLEIDELVSWKELMQDTDKIEVMLESVNWDKEVLPLASKYIVNKFPELWSSESGYKSYIRRRLRSFKILIEYILGKCNFLNYYEYKPKSEKNWSYVISPFDLDKTKVILEKMLSTPINLYPGNLKSFRKK